MKTTCFLKIIAVILLISSTSIAAMQSTNYQIEPTAFSSAGGTSISTSYSTSFTLGQSTAIGESTSASYELLAGFWQQLQELVVMGDLDGDGDVDLYDVIIGLKVLSGGSVDGVTTDGDVNDDKRVGMEEVLFDLNKTSQ